MKRLHFGMLLEFLEALSTLTVVLLLNFCVGLLPVWLGALIGYWLGAY